ncbi:osmoprotectant transport system permease protein [Deinobacterium chartae]|uniref:Osmoprotectant transport system permease protein n=1 Tax=Deinobacterium chartae TaxID=521158 RepID=A0A841HU99_9DEIO|nr:ABC transporter permease subunit [Deinobacterium chartae]MBB6096927.1 osmoprotectant transport system permease protein [Deinobacterium chartae]
MNRVALLGGLTLLGALTLPWTQLRPNRLAAGVFTGVWQAPAWGWTALLLATLLLLTAARPWTRGSPLPALIACAAALFAVLALGGLTRLALEDQGPIARASASSGLWLWWAGSLIALQGALSEHREHGGTARLRAALHALWLVPAALFVGAGGWEGWSVWRELQANGARLQAETLRHLTLSGSALGLGLLIGLPLGIAASRSRSASALALGATGTIQTLPSLALLGLLIFPLAALAERFPALRAAGISGIGSAPALIALTLYALLPIVRNTLVGLRTVSPAATDAARGMGMTPAQVLLRVELPLALPVLLAGVRQAAVLLIGVTAVAALIGAGGLGVFVFQGLAASANDLILLGALPAALLAIAADALLRALEGSLARRYGRPG